MSFSDRVYDVALGSEELGSEKTWNKNITTEIRTFDLLQITEKMLISHPQYLVVLLAEF